MSSEPLLSIVLPVYNVAPYLPACLDSLAALDPPADEIIAVDDGSSDASPEILASYAARLPQLRIIRQPNGGLSVARNVGLEAARGKYLAFVDSDDFVEADAYRLALRLIEEDALDMVLVNARYHFEGRRSDCQIYPGIASSGVMSGREWLRDRLRGKRLLHMVWMHVYRRRFIEEHCLRFIPGLIHEDVIWTTQALLAARRVRYIDHVAVNYRIPVRKRPPAQQQLWLEKIVASSLVNAEALCRMAEEQGEDQELRELLSWQAVDGALAIFHKLAKMPDRKVARSLRARLLNEGWFGLLWQHARGFDQRRRLARQFLISMLAKIAKPS
ncbi:MAG: glycosyltransferase [Rhodocyclaceae bacterium]|nr:glycosyltransferase [Rhodocyclaceae bacterium]